ncbi:DUF3489 domain-containing protein [Paracoccaceae bacterium Fryx2]|nr:DUF3489 domain-containing protein [Paracoccaceae bacterium Fryx2]
MSLDPTQRHQIKQDPALTKLTDTQTIILSAGAQRPDNIALPLPKGLHGAAAKMAVTKMIAHGWLQEVDANLRQCEPLWRETGDGQGTTLIATAAGLKVIGIEPWGSGPVATDTPGPKARTPRTGTKHAAMIDMLSRPEGATVEELSVVTQWMGHTVRGAISGTLKKRLGLVIASSKDDRRGRVYRLANYASGAV